VDSQAVENHSLLSEDFADGQLPAGPPGPPGEPGPPGSGAAPTIKEFAAYTGGSAVIPAGNAYKIIGPTATFSAVAGDRITGVAPLPLTYNGAGNLTINLDLCYQATGGGVAVNFNAANYQHTIVPQPNTGAAPFTATGSVAVPPGSWDVGICVRNNNA